MPHVAVHLGVGIKGVSVAGAGGRSALGGGVSPTGGVLGKPGDGLFAAGVEGVWTI